ncbi:ATP-binding protein [Actinocorallia sp. A-T 12471]|uniref:ATP-binding protein n=1 Tax=Actinocorallia sp. A-T 12471 TaxID=3089813 RepID=UPI0029CDCE28|nr:ATP-binding protein [Actinocorallia sp. A-T 12471]MDX6741729.1 ATP-binding protein [Actinocorallia sp. A-T 12471]
MPGRARKWAAGVSKTWATEAALDTLRLLTSEVATNALQHGGARGIVRVAVLRREGEGRVRVEVYDEGGGVPCRRVAREDDEDGRGLFLLDVLAHSWGHDPGPDGRGTLVWFEIDAKADG